MTKSDLTFGPNPNLVIDFLKQNNLTLESALHDLQSKFDILNKNLIDILSLNMNLQAQNQQLKDEIARLKNTPQRPKLPPGNLEGGNKRGGGSGGQGW